MNGWEFNRFAVGDPVIAVDPGLHTGVANLGPDGAVFAGEGTWEETLDYLQYALNRLLPYAPRVVCETYKITTQTAKLSQAPWSLEGIGAVRFLCRRYGARLEMQDPVEAKRFVTNPRLKAQGWYKSTPGGHVNDALRHLYLWLAKDGRLVPPAGVV